MLRVLQLMQITISGGVVAESPHSRRCAGFLRVPMRRMTGTMCGCTRLRANPGAQWVCFVVFMFRAGAGLAAPTLATTPYRSEHKEYQYVICVPFQAIFCCLFIACSACRRQQTHRDLATPSQVASAEVRYLCSSRSLSVHVCVCNPVSFPLCPANNWWTFGGYYYQPTTSIIMSDMWIPNAFLVCAAGQYKASPVENGCTAV